MPQMLGPRPGTVIALEFADSRQVARPEPPLRPATRQATRRVRTDLDRRPWTTITLDGGHVGGAGHGEVAAVGAVRPFAKVLALDNLRDQAVKVQIALPMAVGP